MVQHVGRSLMENYESGKFDSFYKDILSNFLKYAKDVDSYEGFVFYGHKDNFFFTRSKKWF